MVIISNFAYYILHIKLVEQDMTNRENKVSIYHDGCLAKIWSSEYLVFGVL